jgi:hypothetical protein
MKESAKPWEPFATYIHKYQEWLFCNIWESQLIWTLRTNLIPDRGFGAASNTCTTRVFTIYRICQHLFQWQDWAVQCTNSDLESGNLLWSTTLGFDALRVVIWCTQMVSITASLFLHLRLLICSTHLSGQGAWEGNLPKYLKTEMWLKHDTQV